MLSPTAVGALKISKQTAQESVDSCSVTEGLPEGIAYEYLGTLLPDT